MVRRDRNESVLQTVLLGDGWYEFSTGAAEK